MPDETELPSSQTERAKMLQNICTNAATYGTEGEERELYERLRREFMADAALRSILPEFIRTCRDTTHVRAQIQDYARDYRSRRAYIRAEFSKILDHLEGANRAPADAVVSDTLATFDAEGVHAVWAKALDRRLADPEGAITSARTLLETVCKRILDELAVAYAEGEELPKLYGMVAENLNLAPAQHTEETFRVILGSCQQVVNRLATLRNKMGDAHGHAAKSAKPLLRHAALAVNLAGTMATFLVETWTARKEAAPTKS